MRLTKVLNKSILTKCTNFALLDIIEIDSTSVSLINHHSDGPAERKALISSLSYWVLVCVLPSLLSLACCANCYFLALMFFNQSLTSLTVLVMELERVDSSSSFDLVCSTPSSSRLGPECKLLLTSSTCCMSETTLSVFQAKLLIYFSRDESSYSPSAAYILIASASFLTFQASYQRSIFICVIFDSANALPISPYSMFLWACAS